MAAIKCPSCGNTIEVPAKKTGLYWGIGCLIAAASIPIIVAVVGLLAAIAIPSFINARDKAQQNVCINNMRVLAAAKDQAAIGHKYKDGNPIAESDVAPFIPNGLDSLVCPKGGEYTLNPIGQEPACSIHGAISEATEARQHPHHRQH